MTCDSEPLLFKKHIMKPSQLAGQLRRIAAAIDSSRNPDRGLVINDIRRVLLAMDPEDQGQYNSNTAGPIDWMKNKKKKYDDNKKLDNDADALHEKTLQTQNPDTSPEILAKLADDDELTIRCDVARNPNTPPKILAKLANDMIRMFVAISPVRRVRLQRSWLN